jgi:hypothetical protein
VGAAFGVKQKKNTCGCHHVEPTALGKLVQSAFRGRECAASNKITRSSSRYWKAFITCAQDGNVSSTIHEQHQHDTDTSTNTTRKGGKNENGTFKFCLQVLFTYFTSYFTLGLQNDQDNTIKKGPGPGRLGVLIFQPIVVRTE